MKAVAYIRVSTDRQDISIEAQESKVRSIADVKNLELCEVIVDRDEFSGDLNRPGMQRLLEMVKNRQINAVVIYRLDRLTRSTRDAINLVEMFDKHKVALVSVIESLDTKTPSGMFFVTMIAAIAELERRNTSDRTTMALRHIKAQGFPAGPAPYGFSAQSRPLLEDGKTRKRMLLVENPEEQHTIRVILDLHSKGESYRNIADSLNDAGYRTRRNGIWYFPAVGEVIRANKPVPAVAK
tara:strand:+ start:542 stop:1258 length:717 start_codon:yes stop_codon:yes gene_type:complete